MIMILYHVHNGSTVANLVRGRPTADCRPYQLHHWHGPTSWIIRCSSAAAMYSLGLSHAIRVS